MRLPIPLVVASIAVGALAVADTAATRDPFFVSSHLRAEPPHPAERVCDGVVYASRPRVTAAGRVSMSPGRARPEPAARTVRSFAGRLALLAGAVDTASTTTGPDFAASFKAAAPARASQIEGSLALPSIRAW